MEMIARVHTGQELKVLILTAMADPEAPVDPDYLPIRPDKEVMELRERMLGVHNPRRRVLFETVYGTRPDQIQQELIRHEPKILHFSGHGSPDALEFEDRDGRSAIVTAALVERIVKSYGELECLVLLACYSHEIAKACAQHVQYVVGSTESIDDVCAPHFTCMFYQALATGRPYSQAFEMGRNQVALVREAEAAKYVIYSK